MITIKQSCRWLLKSMQLQLFISFISLPFLIAWGLPISLLTPISTLIFTPFLSAFLLIASCIFFSELLYLPNGFFIWLLEKITAAWLFCLSYEQRAWLICFAKPPWIVLLCIPLVALAIIHSKKINSVLIRTSILGTSLVMLCCMLAFFPSAQHKTVDTIACNKGMLTIITHGKTTVVIDPGFIAAKPSYESLISYTLVPEFIQKTGKLTIDHLIIGKFNKRMLDALSFLATKINIRNLYIPAWQGKIPSFAWHAYVNLKKTIAENNGKIVSIFFKKQIQFDDAQSFISIEPVATKPISYYDATYNPLLIAGTIDNQTLLIEKKE